MKQLHVRGSAASVGSRMGGRVARVATDIVLSKFDQRQPTQPTAAQREQLARLGEDVARRRNHPHASGNLKQQLARVLIVKIYLNSDLHQEQVQRVVSALRAGQRRPLPDDPRQAKLF